MKEPVWASKSRRKAAWESGVVSIVSGVLLASKGVGAIGWIVIHWLLAPLRVYSPRAKEPPDGPFGFMIFLGLCLIAWGIRVAVRKRQGCWGVLFSAIIATAVLSMGRKVPTGDILWFEACIGAVLLLVAAWCACLEIWLAGRPLP